MSFDRERFAPYSFILAILALLFAAGWYIVNRQLGLPGQIALGIVVLGVAGGILLDPAKAKQALSGRQARYGGNALLLTLSFAGILGVANYFVFQNPQTWDLTEDQQFSLSPETKDLIATLDEPVVIKGFYTPDAAGSRENIEPLLNRYQSVSDGLVQVEFIDPRQRPLEADQYGVTRDGSLVVIQGDRSELVSFANERELTSAIIRVTSPGERVVYFVTGHGERDISATDDPGYSQVQSSLESKNYRVETLSLLATATVPEDANVVVLPGPDSPLSLAEVETLGNYLADGGSLLILLEPAVETDIEPAENELLNYLESDWGLRARNDVVVDLGSNLPLAGIAVSYGNHPITNRMGNLASFFPSGRSLMAIDAELEAVTQTNLVQTGQNSWGETNFESITGEDQLGFDQEADTAGPLILAYAAANNDSGSRLVLFGDSDFAANANYFGLGNGDLFINSVDWLAGEEDLIQITPRERTQRTVVPPSVQTVGLIFLLTVIVIPGASIGAGVAVWWRRRRRMG